MPGFMPPISFVSIHVLKPSHPSAFFDNFQDFFRLSRYLSRERFDVLNVHQSHDHTLGGLAARWSKEPVLVIRTDHQRDFSETQFRQSFPHDPSYRRDYHLFGKGRGDRMLNTSICPSKGFARSGRPWIFPGLTPAGISGT